MKTCPLLRQLISIFLLFMFSHLIGPVSNSNAGNFNVLGGVAGALGELGRQLEERGREQRLLEQQKELMRYQYELEAQRLRLAEEARKRDLEREKQNATYTGTGFFVNPSGYFVTNGHVVEDKNHVAIRDSKGKYYRVTIVAQDKQHDLVLLHTNGSFPALHIMHSDKVQKGQHVLTVGYPQISIQGNESKVTDGIINSFSGLKNDDNWFQISVPIQGGNSGGPLINENGDVIGVIVASVDDQKFYSRTGSVPQSVNYAIKSRVLIQFLSAQKVSNISQRKGKTSIDTVDKATVLVIAQNSPIDVTYEEKPIDKKAEDAKLTQLHPNWQALVRSHDFKNWQEDTPSAKDFFEYERARDRAKVLDAYHEFLKYQQESAIHAAAERGKLQKEREIFEKLKHRDDEVARTYSDWPEVKKNPEFLDWITIQPESTRNMVESLNPADIINIVKLYKEQPVKKLVEIGRVKSIVQQYDYIVFALNDPEYQYIENVILLSNGRRIKGTAEKRVGGDVSVSINNDDISGIKKEESVFVYQ